MELPLLTLGLGEFQLLISGLCPAGAQTSINNGLSNTKRGWGKKETRRKRITSGLLAGSLQRAQPVYKVVAKEDDWTKEH